MIELPKVEEVVKKLKEQFSGTQWGDQLSDVLTTELPVIVEQLQEIKRCNMSFLPLVRNMFQWLHECPYEVIKVVIMTDMLVTGVQGKEGLPMSTNRTKPGYMVQRLRKSLGYSKWDKSSCNLSRWCEQGVLIMPVSPTTTQHTRTQHVDMWSNMISYVIIKINEGYPDIPWIMIGEQTERYRNQIRSKHIYNLRLIPRITGQECWKQINKVLKEQGETEIKW